MTGEKLGLGWEGGGAERWRGGSWRGRGCWRQSGACPSAPSPPQRLCASFGRMLRDALGLPSPCALRWGKCLPTDPGLEAPGQMGSRLDRPRLSPWSQDLPHSSVDLTYFLLSLGSGWPCWGWGWGGGTVRTLLLVLE